MIKIVKRNLFKDLKEHLIKKEMSLIIGPRQVGKTTLMLLLKDELEKSGERVVYLSLDKEMDMQYFSSQNSLINKLELELSNEHGYVFIDEIQRKENAGIFLKGIYDMNLPYKFIISGSGSLELKEKIHESLAGRKRFFELNPIAFDEFVNLKTEYRYENSLEKFFSLEKTKTGELLNEYLNFGGYPRVVLEKSLEEKRKNIDEIVRSYLEKDIVYLLNVERRDAFTSLVRILASQTGQLVNYSEIASLLGLSVGILKTYLWYAEKTFVIQTIQPYFQNSRKEIIKSPTMYFYDLGFKNYSIGSFGNLINPKEIGFVFQNFIFNILREKLKFTGASIHFWRTKDKAEVDFIINSGKDVIPVEVKYKMIKKVEIERSLRSFIEKYNPEKAFIVNLDYDSTALVNQTKVIFIPYWKLITKEF